MSTKKDPQTGLPKTPKREYRQEDSIHVLNPDAPPKLFLGTTLRHLQTGDDYVITALIYPSYPRTGIEVRDVEIVRIRDGKTVVREARAISAQWKDGVFAWSPIPPIAGETYLDIQAGAVTLGLKQKPK